ncbi:MAG: mechanosensitive ion channel family protein [Candidatus Diapherotrites archaeon]|nr:mechanosensitive ion channel family protein [Candidatus Diapherotrites archaeon]
MAGFNVLQVNFENLLNQSSFGISVYHFLVFFAVILAGAVVGKVLTFWLKHYGAKLAAKTENQFDDAIIEIAGKSVFYFCILLSLYVGFQFLEIQDLFVSNTFYKILSIAGILFAVRVVLQIIDSIVTHFVKPLTAKTKSELDDQLVPLIQRLSKVFVILIALLMIVSSFGYDVTALIAGLGIGGLAFAFAAQKTIADMFGGLSIFTSKPFFVGDNIELGDKSVSGKVEEIGLRYTRIRNRNNFLVTVSNSEIASAQIINLSRTKIRKEFLELGLTYSTSNVNLEKARSIVLTVIGKHPKCNAPDAQANFLDFKEFSLNLQVVIPIVDVQNWKQVKHEVNMKIKEEFEKAGIQFAFPTQTVFLQK